MQRSSPLGRLLGVGRRGVCLGRPLAGRFAAFLAVPRQTAIDGALDLVKGLRLTAITLLSTEQRAALARTVSGVAQAVAPLLVTALAEIPELAQAAGLDAARLLRRRAQVDTLVSAGRAVQRCLRLCHDARLQLQAWQYEAQRRLTHGLFVEFVNAPTTGDRLQIVADAGPLLDLWEATLKQQRDTRATNARAAARSRAEQDQVSNDLQMLETMRAVRAQQPVDEALLQRMALYYEERVRPDPAR